MKYERLQKLKQIEWENEKFVSRILHKKSNLTHIFRIRTMKKNKQKSLTMCDLSKIDSKKVKRL